MAPFSLPIRAHAVTPRPAHGARAHPPHGHLLGRRDGGAAADFSRRRRSPSSIAVSSPNNPKDLKPSTGWASGLMKRLSIFTNSGEKKEVEVEEKDDENHSASVVDDGCNDDSKIDDDDSREPPAVQPIEEQSGVGWGRGFPATTTDQPKEEDIIISSGSRTMTEEEESEDAEEERIMKTSAQETIQMMCSSENRTKVHYTPSCRIWTPLSPSSMHTQFF